MKMVTCPHCDKIRKESDEERAGKNLNKAGMQGSIGLIGIGLTGLGSLIGIFGAPTIITDSICFPMMALGIVLLVYGVFWN